MTSRVQTLRSSTKGARPSGRAAGELYVNFAEHQLGVVSPSGNLDLLAVRTFSTTADYAIGDLVARGGDIYRAAVAVTAGPWNGTQWTDIVNETDSHHGVTLHDPSKKYLQNELVAQGGEIFRANSVVNPGAWQAALWTKISPTPATAQGVAPFSINDDYAANALVAYQGHIYRAKAAITKGAWDATKWTDLDTTYVLSAATATVLGGVKANAAPVAGQFVTGIAADGALTYAAVTGGLAYIGTKDCTTPYVAPATAPTVGSFLTNTGTGPMDATWTAVTSNPPATVSPGDTMVWDGTLYHHNVGTINAIPAATATTLGAVIATVNPGTAAAPQFVNGLTATGALSYATAGDAYLDHTQSWTKAQRGAPVTGNGSFDFAAANNFAVAGAGAVITIANPTNAAAGQSGAIVVDNAASLAFGTNFKFEGGTAPTGSGAGKKDILVYYVADPTAITAKLLKDVH